MTILPCLLAAAINPFEHVVDSDHFELLFGWKIHLPGKIKFMLMELLAAGIVAGIYIWAARRIRTGEVPRGKLLNGAEFVLLFIRDTVVRPSIGHGADKFLPLLWTQFLFILVCNLLGMVPFLASPTASIMVTGALALCSFVTIHTMGFIQNGAVGYMRSFVPHIEMDTGFLKLFGPVMLVGMAFLEVLTAFIRSFVLAVRLFANMLAGHTTLFVLLLFIQMVGVAAEAAPSGNTADWLFWPITFGSLVLVTAMSLLEMFVAALQAFVFTFLTAVFIGLAMHPQH